MTMRPVQVSSCPLGYAPSDSGHSPEIPVRTARTWSADNSSADNASADVSQRATICHRTVRKTIVFSTTLLVKNMPRIGGFRSFHTARRTIQGFEAMLWLRKGSGFASARTVREQNHLLALC